MNTNNTTIDIKEKERTTWIWIKHQLALQGSSFANIASIYAVSETTFAKVKHFPYPKSERRIAESIGLQPHDLWPWRYDAAGNPNRISSRYQGHKVFLSNTTENENKINGKEQRRNCHETQN